MNDPESGTYPPRPEAVYVYGTCLIDLFFPQAGLAAVELIERQGVRVIFPQAQTCCGQPAFNTGYRHEARAVARKQMALFPKPIPIVVPSGSCGSMMRVHYPELFRGQPEESAAIAFAGRVFEWSDFMVNVLRVTLEDKGPPTKVTYHPSCHLTREMGVREAPLTLLGQLSAVEVQPLADAETCCGFGGTFAVKMGPISEAMAADKADAVTGTCADVLVSADSGCLLNIGGVLRKREAPVDFQPLPLFIRERVAPSRAKERGDGT